MKMNYWEMGLPVTDLTLEQKFKKRKYKNFEF